MDERTLRVLEFDKVRQRLKDMITYAPAVEAADALMPATSAQEVERLQEETQQACHLLETGVDLYLGHLVDIRPLLKRAAVGAVLEEEELAAIAETLATARQLSKQIRAAGDRAPLFVHRFGSVPDLVNVETAILSRLTPDRRLKDDASPELRSLRQRLRVAQARLRATLEEWVRRASQQGLLQEASFTVRNGRYVLPVRQDRRDSVPGIVHDQSSSGATLFIEPAPLVELGNQIRELESQEQAERRRILTRLTRWVADVLPGVQAVVRCLTESDFAAAKARLARHYRCIRPELETGGRITLRAARHPLLEEERMAGRLERVVPLDLTLEPHLQVLLITGPNTGGKTVTLKTIGLLALMFQAGLQIPAEAGTALPVFSRVFADIGDEQSIEQSLSTFSSHMSHIIQILGACDASSLVLLDELGAGTDPQEGAALAMAILDYLVDRGCRVVATTHYGQLKSYAHARPEMVNASVEFDAQSLAPTYRLQVGLPGRSMALEIAARLGLSPDIVEAARGYMGTQALHFEELLADLEAQRRRLEAEAEKVRREREELEQLRSQLQAQQKELEARRQEWLQQARSQADEILRKARQEAEQWIGIFRKAGAEEWVRKAQEARARLLEQSEELSQQLRETQSEAEKPAGGPRSLREGGPITPGSRVWVESLQQEGQVLEVVGKREALVQVGPMRMLLPLDGLRLVEPETGDSQERQGRGRRRWPVSGAQTTGSAESRAASGVMEAARVSPEVHLLGLTAEEAIHELEKFLDRARMAGLDRVRIIHGKGTGVLRKAVAEYLARQPYVVRFSLASPEEGGTGATVAELN